VALPALLAWGLLACSAPAAGPAAPAKPAPAAPASGQAPAAAAAPTSAPAPAQLTTVNLSLPSTGATTVIMTMAEDEGFYARQGLHVESTFYQGGPPALQAMVAGAADLTLQITGTTLNAIANGADLAIVAGQQADPDYQFYARPEITSGRELAGKRIASADPGSELNTFVRRMMAVYGLTPDDYDLVSVGSTATRYAALTAGAVDATLLQAPFIFDAQDRGLRHLGSVSEAVPKYMFTTIATKRDWAGQNADTVVRFIRGYQEFLVWMADPAHKDAIVQHWIDVSKSSPEAAAKTYDLYMTGPLKDKVISPRAEVDRAGLQAVIDLMLEADILKRPLTVDQVLDLSYWERASQR
jgi:NitT/TauT family transport system substrate-binding protein